MKKNSNVKKSLYLSQLNCTIADISSEILDLVKGDKKGGIYTKFVRNFLKYIPIDYRSKDKIDLFGDFTHEAFEFFKNKPAGEHKVKIFPNKYRNDPAITILIAAENRPFIIDSLNSLMSKLALQAVFTFHPVIYTVRDDKGKLTDILGKREHGTAESLVYIKALGTFDKAAIDKITEEINVIIGLVNYTYNSWQPLLNKIISITTDVVHSTDIYESEDLPVEETLDFLNWLQKNNITFLGTVDFDVESKALTNEDGVRDIWKDNLEEISTIIEFSKSEYYEKKLVMLGKINKLSPVHRNALVDYILVKRVDKDGVYRSGTIIFGLYGTAIYFQSIKSIPILRGKMNYVLDKSEFPVNGFNSKKIKNIIESLPRDILIQIDEEDLYCMCIHMLSSMRSHRLKVFVQQDWSNSFINVIIFLPREKLTPEVYNEISCYLKEKFGSEIIADNITVVAQDFSHLFATLAIKDILKLDFSHEEMEKDLIQITTNWSESLLDRLCCELGEYDGASRHKDVAQSFPAEYRHKFDAGMTIDDIHHLEKASRQNELTFNLIQGEDNEYVIKFYSPEIKLTLSDTLPAIENLGFIAVDEQSFAIAKSSSFKKSWIYEFKLSSPIKIGTPFDKLKENIEEALCKMSSGELASDVLSKLLVVSGFNWSKVKLIKSLTRYLHQTGFIYGKGYVQKTLVSHHIFTEMLADLFEARFCPKAHSEKNVKSLSAKMGKYLDEVSSSTEDKVLKNMMLIIEAITRTNFYQNSVCQDNEKMAKSYLSFKFDSSKVPDLPLPIPYAEIFVYSNDFEGIHLRGGKVARGGLRWSDRGEDYRTEVLGLMKSQMTKNTVIVPVGSKGTFYLSFAQGNMSREVYMKKVVACYQNFLRGLLDITDNLVNGKIMQPKDTIIYDAENPYLVVAADKGTASFSDYANAVSAEYNFWLGDAFASGGSLGYDHKRMGITAKGAWISAQLHFMEMGVDIQKEQFSVVAIGDMSGDVFGNGMLLSKYTNLVAAFNHQHIFIDPTPDHKTSYKERQRLFAMVRSSWTDYNLKLISKGGGIFSRSEKTINISAEIKELLGIKCSSLTPDELIRSILKAETDLIWNGGIGTYIKSSSENNIDIGDKANDNLRVNGNEVRAKVISEGGNLGLSQLGRIEYALSGGRINTDFIDNSAGVDCSDHEVNIKITLNEAVASGKITTGQRNKILEQMTDGVEELVLADNHSQNLALTIAEHSPLMNIESFSQLIKEMEKAKLLDAENEFLPNKSELSRRSIAGEGMTRAELAVLLSYSKMSVDTSLATSSLADDAYFQKYLFEYFPQVMREKFSKEIEAHPLRQEIIRTVITNKMVNQLGGTEISSIKRETGASLCDIARAHSVVVEIFDLDNLWEKIAKLGTSVDVGIKVEMFSDLGKIMRRGISWFVRNIKAPINVNNTIKEFSKQTADLTEIISKLLVGTTKTRFFSRIEHYKHSCVDEEFARSVATLEVLVSAFDIIHIATTTENKNKDIANLYFESGDVLSIDWLRQSCEAQVNESYWNRLSIQSLKDDFYDKQRRLVIEIASQAKPSASLESWLEEHSTYASIFINFVEDIKMQETVDLNMIILANKKLEIFLRKLGAS
ncbi:MAG: glutamate dehydrogenase [Rickettsiales bacterium]|nr:MAG: glutamate dehydrogenase [Rickettsiales bacterium]